MRIFRPGHVAARGGFDTNRQADYFGGVAIKVTSGDKILLWCFGAFMAALAISMWISAQRANRSVNVGRSIRGAFQLQMAIEQWATENGKKEGDTVVLREIAPYVGPNTEVGKAVIAGKRPTDPLGNEYIIGALYLEEQWVSASGTVFPNAKPGKALGDSVENEHTIDKPRREKQFVLCASVKINPKTKQALADLVTDWGGF